MSGRSTPTRPGPAPEAGTTAVGRPPRPPMGPGRGGPFAGMNIPAEKAMNFWPSARRLLGQLQPERLWLMLVLVLGVAGVTLSVIGPRLLGEGTNIIFAGVVSKQLPAGTSKAELIAQLRAAGENQKADMLSAMALTPGAGIDFTALAGVLLWALVLYVLASGFMWIQAYVLNGVVQRTVFRLRERIEAKINRLPLRYFDSIQRGELLSRVTNDVDNISQSLQQSISQAVMSLLTVAGVLLMMFLLSPALAVIALVTIPLTLGITALIAKRSQKLFVAQWKHTGELNGQIEETYTGHALVKVFGRQHEVGERFRQKNAELYEASFGAQFISGLIMPAMTFIGNLVYVGIAVVGGLQVASGAMQLGDVQAFIQYSRQFTQPLAQLGSMANLLQSGVASAERVFELLDEDEQSPDPSGSGPVGGRGRLVFESVSFSYSPDKPLISSLSLVAEPGQTVAIVGPTGAGKTTLVNLMMRFYEIDAGRITLDGVDVTSVSRRELRSRMGMVLQDTWLFGGTIRDNIAYGRPSAPKTRSWRRRRRRTWTGSCTPCRRGTTPCWRTRAPTCPPVRSSC
jgi:ATP-binding cassette subfamily B multidrug efflux pump